MRRDGLMVALALTLTLGIAHSGELGLTQSMPDRYGGLVAGRLAGSWVIDRDSTERLGGSTENVSLTFSADAEMRIPEKWRRTNEMATVFQTGTIEIIRKRDLVIRSVSLKAACLLSQEGDVLCLWVFGIPATQNVEVPSGKVSIVFVPATDKRNDLLYVGGDPFSTGPFNVGGPFAVYERVRK